MYARGLTTNDVVSAEQGQNIQVAAGRLGAPPAPKGTAFTLTINTLGRLVTPDQFKQIVVQKRIEWTDRLPGRCLGCRTWRPGLQHYFQSRW